MGAAEQQKFSQYPYQYGDGLRGAALAQTRNGKDELITPIAFWELDAATGLYMPPGMSSNPRKPRVEATLTGRLQIMDRIVGIRHELGPGETYKTERPLDASKIQSDIATIVVAGLANARRDIDVYVSMRPPLGHETEKMLVYSSLEDAVPQATHVFSIVLQYPEFYLHVTNRSSSTFTVETISLVGRG